MFVSQDHFYRPMPYFDLSIWPDTWVRCNSNSSESGKGWQSGVTMIEMLVVIGVVAVLAVMAAPSLVSTSQTIKQRAAGNLLADDLNRTKSEAIKRNTRVLMCARNADGSDCAATSNWQVGWLVCVEDSAAVGHCLAGTGTSPNPIVVRAGVDAALTLVKASATSTDPVRFSANSTATAATLTLGGTWSGATNRVANIAATGGITLQ